MPNTAKTLFRGAATTNTATVLYTTPASTTTVVTSIVASNNSTSGGTITLSLGGVVLAPALAIAANSIITLDIRQVLATTTTITGGASSTSINFHISGMETT